MLSQGAFPGGQLETFVRLGPLAIVASDSDAIARGGVVPIVIAIILGAFCGLLAGFILARLVRFAAFLAGKHFEGNWLIFVGMIAGAILCAYWAMCGR